MSDRQILDKRVGVYLFILAFVGSGIFVSLTEWAIYTSSRGVIALLNSSALILALSVFLAVVLYLPFSMGLAFFLRKRALFSILWRGEQRVPFLFFWFFFMAFVPYPVFRLLGQLTSKITDTELLIRFSSSAAILAIAASIGISALLSWAIVSTLKATHFIDFRMGFFFFYTFAFPTPILVLPLLAIAFDSEPFVPAARGLFLALLFIAVPVMIGIFRLIKISWSKRLGQIAIGLTVVLFILSASGTTFRQRSLFASPFSALLFKAIKKVVDRYKDGYINLFEGLDCDESNKQIHAMAYDIPNNKIDENCDGKDALEKKRRINKNSFLWTIKKVSLLHIRKNTISF